MHAPDAAALPGPPPEDDATLDLDTRIRLVEQRLVAREQRVGRQARQLASRAQALADPGTLAWKLAGMALAGGGLTWLLRRGPGHGHGGMAGHPLPAPSAGLTPLLLSLLPVAWPALPLRWRHRISPATAASVLGLALPLVQALVQRLRRPRRP